MPSLSEWFLVRFDDSAIILQVSPPGGDAWQAAIAWERIIRICFEAGDWMESDIIYIFTDERPESYAIPTEAGGGQALWNEILDRKLFDAEMAIEASMATNKLFCCPPAEQQPAAPEPVTLASPGQLPELEGETLVLMWDQIEFDTIILHGERVVWRERTGWEVYDRFEEIAAILKQKYGKRLVDLVPAPRSLYALYGDSTAANFHVAFVRRLLRERE